MLAAVTACISMCGADLVQAVRVSESGLAPGPAMGLALAAGFCCLESCLQAQAPALRSFGHS